MIASAQKSIEIHMEVPFHKIQIINGVEFSWFVIVSGADAVVQDLQEFGTIKQF